MRSILIVALLGFLIGCTRPPAEGHLIVVTHNSMARLQAIPPADPSRYTNLQQMKSWRNPYLIVEKDGVLLFDAANNEQRPIDTDHILDVLAALPPSAWPYGRVVAVQENAAATSEPEKIALRRSRAVLAGTLESAKILINWVPSA